MEAFELGRAALAYKRNLIAASAVAIVGNFLGLPVFALTFFSDKIANVPVWKIDTVVMVIVFYFAFVYSRAYSRDWQDWKIKNQIETDLYAKLGGALHTNFPKLQFDERGVRAINNLRSQEEVEQHFLKVYKTGQKDSGKNTWEHILATRKEMEQQSQLKRLAFRTSIWTDLVIPCAVAAIAIGWIAFARFYELSARALSISGITP